MNRFKLNRIELKTGTLLLFGCIVGCVFVAPYSHSLLSGIEITLIKLILSTLVNALITFPILIYFGLLLKRTAPIAGTPILDGAKRLNKRDVLIYGVMTGLIGWALIHMLEVWFQQMIPELRKLNQKEPSALLGFLASFLPQLRH